MNFYQEVFRYTQAIPPGKVATYGQIAALIGSPRAARMVGMALARSAGQDIPWQRVINRQGMISIENMHLPKEEQARRLEAEGVEVVQRDGNYFIDLQGHLIDGEELRRRAQHLKDGEPYQQHE